MFIDLGGVEGLIHISELSWGRVSHPGQIVQLGQEIDAQVLEISPERCRVALSLKRLLPNPWEKADTDFAVGQIVPAVVTSIVSYGAFARLEAGIEGLIHASEMPLDGWKISPRCNQRKTRKFRFGFCMSIQRTSVWGSASTWMGRMPEKNRQAQRAKPDLKMRHEPFYQTDEPGNDWLDRLVWFKLAFWPFCPGCCRCPAACLWADDAHRLYRVESGARKARGIRCLLFWQDLFRSGLDGAAILLQFQLGWLAFPSCGVTREISHWDGLLAWNSFFS